MYGFLTVIINPFFPSYHENFKRKKNVVAYVLNINTFYRIKKSAETFSVYNNYCNILL